MKKSLLLLLWMIQMTLMAQVSLNVDLNQSGSEISPDLIGVFFEDINYAADGGLYAELVQNRSFEYYTVDGYVDLEPLYSWSIVETGGASAAMSIQNSSPLNQANENYLQLTVSNAGTEAGIQNSGYGEGIPIVAGDIYKYSVYLKSEGEFTEPVVINVKHPTGVVLCTDTIKNISKQWQKYTGELEAKYNSGEATLQLVTKGTGIIDIDMLSLFPQNTFNQRENGLRADLAQAIADLNPRFVRFPGGCISHGRGIENAYRWKESVGDIAERAPNWNLWGYHQTYGLGFYEYFLYCEDIDAIALPVVPVGVSCQFRNREIVPIEEMEPWINDALDLVEFANGDVSTTWGSVRAEMGHPEPFNMEYICLGNEEDDIPEFRERFKMISDSLKKYYPEIQIIGTSGTSHSGTNYEGLWDFSDQEELAAVDEHYYVEPSWYLSNNHRYDHFDRTGPKVFIGEYASWDDLHYNAIAEASYLTGVERNADIIQFTCYAPLLCRDNQEKWHPNLMRFDNNSVMKTANYYVQQLFSLYTGEKYLDSEITYEAGSNVYDVLYEGNIGVGTWNTQAEFDDITVVSGEETIISESFSTSADNWEVLGGTFSASNGVYVQSSSNQPAWSILSQTVNQSDYTFSLKAKKTGGAEGFLIPFGFKDSNNYYWLNLGGWGNTIHAIEQAVDGSKSTLVSKSGVLENDVWYDIRIEVNKSNAVVFLNGELLFNIPSPDGPLTASVVKNESEKQVIIKVVNTEDEAIDFQMDLNGLNIASEAKLITLAGDASVRNTMGAPNTIVPVESSIVAGNQIIQTIPAYSLNVFVLDYSTSTALKQTEGEVEKSNKIWISPNPSSGFALLHKGDELGEGDVTIYDLSGKAVWSKSNVTESTLRIEKNDMNQGTYIVRYNSDSAIFSTKLLWTK